MDNSNIPRFPVNPRQLQPTTLSALADDASSLAATQQALGDPTEPAHTFQPYQSSPPAENQHCIQNVNPNDTPGFIRPPRPGEPTNNLLLAPQHHRTQQYQTASAIEQQQQLTNSNELRLREASGTGNHDRLGLIARAGQLGPRDNSSVSSQLRSTPEMRLDMLQSTGSSSIQQQAQQEPPFALAVNKVDKNADLQKGMKLVPDPPDLNLWREKLFHVDETIILSENQYGFLFILIFSILGEVDFAHSECF